MLAQPPVWFILIAFVCALGPLVFIHEFGHYWVGRMFGVGAESFSIGFGREILGWTDKRGTRWKVGWLPLGGYVRFVGDMNPASAPAALDEVPLEDRARSFHAKPVWQRFLIVLAGPAANFLLAILIFAAFFALVGAPRANVVGAVLERSAASAAGLKPGDRIISVAGRKTPSFSDLTNVVALRPNQSVVIVFERGKVKRETRATLTTETHKDSYGGAVRRGLLGVSPAADILQPIPIYRALPEAVDYTFRLTGTIVDGVGQIVAGRLSVKELGGPIRIARVAGEGASLGALPFIQLLALLSINLGFINLLPVPMLDGGHLLFYGVEAVRRRPVSPRTMDWAFRGGVAAILALMVLTTVNDLGAIGLWDRLGRLIG